ncbi:MAG: hypothetical protein HY268_13005 [Deltaproteobacteria bacterium]|nr:hypothetical protein [Deltaproteobacteria bacterium]
MSYRFTRYQPQYRAEVVQLQTALWSPDLALNSAHLTWKYEQNPYLNEPLIHLALYNERVVGMRGFCGAQWEIGHTGQAFIMPAAGDTTIAAEHRRGGLLRQLLQFAHTDRALTAFPYILGFSAGVPVYFCALSEGWRVIGTYDTLARVAPIRKLLKSKTLKNLARRVKHFPAIDKLLSAAAQLRRSPSSFSHIQISSNPRVEDMASVVARTDRPDKIRQHKDSDYYAWRFRSPLSRYQFFYWQKTTLEGFLVLQQSLLPTAGPTHLIDWAATTPEVLTELLQVAIHAVGLGSLELWAATLPEAMVATLHKQGFTPAESPLPNTTYRPSLLGQCMNATMFNGEWRLAERRVTEVENWELRMICGDQY